MEEELEEKIRYGFTNDFVFCTVLRKDKKLCMEFVERILDIKVRDIVYIDSQESIDIGLASKGIRLDVYVSDELETVYDLEMQTTVTKDLPKRSRYYQSMIDQSLIDKGAYYSELKKSFVVFICLSDPFKRGLSRYRFSKICKEDSELQLLDGTETVFINAQGTHDGISKGLCELLDYLITSKPGDEFTKAVHKSVEETNKDPKWRKEQMTVEMKLQEKLLEGKEIGMEQGKEIGIEQGKKEGILKALREGYISAEGAARVLEITKEKLMEML